MRLALSYAAVIVMTGALLLAVVLVFMLRYVPETAIMIPGDYRDGYPYVAPTFVPGQMDIWVTFAPRAALAMGFLLVVGAGGGWLLAGRMLAPLRQIQAATHTAMDGTLSHRVALKGRRDEFSDLADSFDEMLERLEAHVAEQRRFAANASHELRTPLAITQTLLEVGRNDPDRNVDDLLDRLHSVNVRAIDLTEALLMLSRADQKSFTSEPVDLSLLLDEAAETLLPLAEKRQVSVRTYGSEADVVGSRALLLQLTTNLLHNAIIHNTSEDGVVWARTEFGSGSAELIVENTGEKLAPELVPTLTEPFQRGTDRVRSDHAGAGLGLAIVRSIVQAHDGTLTVTARPDGGLRVSVVLPARVGG